jgi:hypothetical protein
MNTRWLTVSIVMSVGLGACSTADRARVAQAPAGGDRPAQIRTALNDCNATAARGTAHSIVVYTDGRYTFKTPTSTESQAMVECMRSKGFSAYRS